MERDGVEVQYPAILTEPAWSIKDLLYGIRAPLFAGHPKLICFILPVNATTKK